MARRTTSSRPSRALRWSGVLARIALAAAALGVAPALAADCESMTEPGTLTDSTTCDASIDAALLLDSGTLYRVWIHDDDEDGYPDEDEVCCCIDDDTCVSSSQTPDEFSASTDSSYTSTAVPDAWDCNDDATDADAADIHDDTIWYDDNDGDGYGDDDNCYDLDLDTDCDSDDAQCDTPVTSGDWVPRGGDCQDSGTRAGTTFPGAAENESSTACMQDYDGDGYGSDDPLPSGSTTATAGTDCDDGDDEVTSKLWWVDADEDGVAASSSGSSTACSDPSTGSVTYIEITDSGTYNEDCDDGDDDTHPGAAGFDSSTDCMTDADGDGFGDDDPASGVEAGTDCDDTDSAINTDADEICDASDVDEDCSGAADDDDSGVDTSTQTAYYSDQDNDGYGTDASETLFCDDPGSPYVTDGGDCSDDTTSDTYAARTFPGAAEEESSTSCRQDRDQDGFGTDTPPSGVTAGTDCDDTDDGINTDATEVCDDDDVDEDCDGDIDDDDSSVDTSTMSSWYPDRDSDTYGDEDAAATNRCDDPSAAITYVENNEDCNDFNSSVNPDGTEVCDTGDEDEDCDGYVNDEDPSVSDLSTWYTDSDGDGFGTSSGTSIPSCDDLSTVGYADNADDCDDSDSSITDAERFYTDGDGDGYGDPDDSVLDCVGTISSGYVDNGDDCDDTSSSVNPDADEVCDDIDNNCDDEIDEDTASDASTWYLDDDEDGFGDEDSTQNACEQPSGYVAEPSSGEYDCDDGDDEVNPDADEECFDGVDNDCDGETDDGNAIDASTFYEDADGDGYGNEDSTTLDCTTPTGYVNNLTDCDDDDADTYPSAPELCDGIDNDCDDDIDEGGTTAVTWYADADGDGFGDEDETEESCDAPDDYVAEPSDGLYDCDDAESGIYPGADETWYDGIDQDCDEDTEYDADGDGYESATHEPDGLGDDCYDNQTEIDDFFSTSGLTDLYGVTPELSYPGSDEGWYDGLDQDCAGDSDYDADGDGYLSATYDPDGLGDDCIDNDLELLEALDEAESSNDYDVQPEDVNPGSAVDYPYDGIDQDCNGSSDFDEDGDGYTSWLYGGEDCVDSVDDFDEDQAALGIEPYDINPDADEVCEPDAEVQIDSDCDGDPNTQGGEPIDGGSIPSYLDEDGDEFGDEASVVYLCQPSELYSSSFGDCDDSNDSVYPGATERCNNADDDCDDLIDEPADEDGDDVVGCIDLYADRDGDGYGSAAEEDKACMCFDGTSVECGEGYEYNPNTGLCYAKEAGDCYDYDPTIKPRASTDPDDADYTPLVELIDGDDNDCNGEIPIIEVDCDDDGSMPLLPKTVSKTTEIGSAEDVGLPDCRGADGEKDPLCCEAGTCPEQACDDIDLQRIVTCWNSADLRATCDEETGLAVISLQADGMVDRFDGGKRIWSGEDSIGLYAGETWGDCDDMCPYRSPDLDEYCDGLDNDCNGSSGTMTDSDGDGLPDSLESTVIVPGYVAGTELDLDGDGFLGCGVDTYERLDQDQSYSIEATCVDSESALPGGDCNNVCAITTPDSETEDLVCNGFADGCSLATPEGTDADNDDYLTCGAWSGEDPEGLGNEEVYLLVYYDRPRAEKYTPAEDGDDTDTGSSDTGSSDTGSSDTGSSDTGSSDTGTSDTGTSDTGTSDTGSSDTGSSDTGASDTGSADTGAADTGAADTGTADTGAADTGAADTGSGDTGARMARPTGPGGFSAFKANYDPSADKTRVIPLVPPRSEALECDQFLFNEQVTLLGGVESIESPSGGWEAVPVDAMAVVEGIMETGDTSAYLSHCIYADACNALENGVSSTHWPLLASIDEDFCQDYGGECAVIRLNVHEGLDDDLYDDQVQSALDTVASCTDYPEQAITRTVWNQTRINQARQLVVQWECYRLYGTWGCGDIDAPGHFDSPYDTSSGAGTPAAGGHFANPDPDDFLVDDTRWWKELGRYSPEAVEEGIISECWGSVEGVDDKYTVSQAISEVTGGDCDDGSGRTHRETAEGPDDLVGLYWGQPGDCDTCLDGIDNNCNGVMDCAEPACARCFVGQGSGCGGGTDVPCAQGGCTATVSAPTRQPSPTGTLLVLLGLIAVGYRTRETR